MTLFQGFKIRRFIIRFTTFPTPKDNPNPLKGQTTNDRLGEVSLSVFLAHNKPLPRKNSGCFHLTIRQSSALKKRDNYSASESTIVFHYVLKRGQFPRNAEVHRHVDSVPCFHRKRPVGREHTQLLHRVNYRR